MRNNRSIETGQLTGVSLLYVAIDQPGGGTGGNSNGTVMTEQPKNSTVITVPVPPVPSISPSSTPGPIPTAAGVRLQNCFSIVLIGVLVTLFL